MTRHDTDHEEKQQLAEEFSRAVGHYLVGRPASHMMAKTLWRGTIGEHCLLIGRCATIVLNHDQIRPRSYHTHTHIYIYMYIYPYIYTYSYIYIIHVYNTYKYVPYLFSSNQPWAGPFSAREHVPLSLRRQGLSSFGRPPEPPEHSFVCHKSMPLLSGRAMS